MSRYSKSVLNEKVAVLIV